MNKRWLSKREAAEYISVSLQTIKRYMQSDVLKEGTHYYKRNSTFLRFDQKALDQWVMQSNDDTETIIQKLLS